MINLRKVPTSKLYRKKVHMATVDHSRNEAGKALNTLRDLNINAEGLLNEISPNSTEEKDMIKSAMRELQEGEEKYFALLEEFDEANSQTIKEITEEINRGHSSIMPPPLFHYLLVSSLSNTKC